MGPRYRDGEPQELHDCHGRTGVFLRSASPWQHGSNENTNGLLCQYFPKGKPVDGYSQAELNKIAARLNGRPRQALQFMNRAEKLAETLGVAMTG